MDEIVERSMEAVEQTGGNATILILFGIAITVFIANTILTAYLKLKNDSPEKSLEKLATSLEVLGTAFKKHVEDEEPVMREMAENLRALRLEMAHKFELFEARHSHD